MGSTSTDTDVIKLTDKQELFCNYYATHRDFFGNGSRAYMEAYPDSNPNSARASASQFLTNPNILKRINELLEYEGLNDVAVDQELAFVIAQHADFGAKVAAIREYNKLKARITERLESTVIADVTSNGQTIANPELAQGYAQWLSEQSKGK